MKAENSAVVNEKRKPLHDIVPLKTPLGITISTCNYCDFKCVYCGHSYEKHIPATLTMEMFHKIADQIAEFEEPIKQISFVASGETILNKQLPDMIKSLKERGLAESIKIITNANKLTHEYADRLIEAGLDVLKISLQGMSSEKYLDICKTRVDFDKFVEQIRYFYKNRENCKVHIKIIDIALDEGQEKQFYDTFGDIADTIFIEECYGEYAKKQSVNKYGMNTEKMHICSMPFYTFFVDELGNVFPCCLRNRYNTDIKCTVGNITERSLLQLWNNEFKTLQLGLLCENVENEVCKHCDEYKSFSKESDMIDEYQDEILLRYH